ncbi:hypothetical protein TWF694_005775 [Orbilia ellipsospora]|uniref:Uncharacterized protein n=1 Tax=Orbilia ellipsospora TaxID=2528407 RepID=A0AAV9WTA6_9PEZI
MADNQRNSGIIPPPPSVQSSPDIEMEITTNQNPGRPSQLSVQVLDINDTQVQPVAQIQSITQPQQDPVTEVWPTIQAPQTSAPPSSRANRRVRFEDGGIPGQSQSPHVPTVTIPSNENEVTTQDIEPEAHVSSASGDHIESEEQHQQQQSNIAPINPEPLASVLTDPLAFFLQDRVDSKTHEEIQDMAAYYFNYRRERCTTHDSFLSPSPPPVVNPSPQPYTTRFSGNNPVWRPPITNRPPPTCAARLQPNRLFNFDFFAPTWHTQHTTINITPLRPPPFPYGQSNQSDELYFINGNGNVAPLPREAYPNVPPDPRREQLTAVTENPFIRAWFFNPRMPDPPREPDPRDGEIQAAVNARYGVAPRQPAVQPVVPTGQVPELSIGSPVLALTVPPGAPDIPPLHDDVDENPSIILAGWEVTLEDVRNAPLIEEREEFSGDESVDIESYERLELINEDGECDEIVAGEEAEGDDEVKDRGETYSSSRAKRKLETDGDGNNENGDERPGACKMPRLM